MPKIIIDARLLSKGGSSGIEEYTRNILQFLLQIDTKNEYLIFYNGFRKSQFPKELLNSRTSLIEKNIPNKLFDFNSRFLKWPCIENLTNGGDLVFSPHFNILKTKLPRIITIHDLSFLHHPDFFSIRQRIWHWMQNYQRQAKEASKIIAVSEFTKNDIYELLKIPKDKIEVIYSGISPIFKKLKEDDEKLLLFKKRYNLSRPYILYLGTIEPRKNVRALIKAFNLLKSDAALNNFELVIAGSLGWLYGETINDVKSSKYRDDIRLLGKIESIDRLYLYNAAEIFAYPSFFEGFGFQPLEAQACGVPVVASNRTSLPEILGKSALFVDPWSVDELHHAIKELLTNKRARESIISEGLKNTERFSWEEAAKKTQALYNKICE